MWDEEENGGGGGEEEEEECGGGWLSASIMVFANLSAKHRETFRRISALAKVSMIFRKFTWKLLSTLCSHNAGGEILTGQVLKIFYFTMV